MSPKTVRTERPKPPPAVSCPHCGRHLMTAKVARLLRADLARVNQGRAVVFCIGCDRLVELAEDGAPAALSVCTCGLGHKPDECPLGYFNALGRAIPEVLRRDVYAALTDRVGDLLGNMDEQVSRRASALEGIANDLHRLGW